MMLKTDSGSMVTGDGLARPAHQARNGRPQDASSSATRSGARSSAARPIAATAAASMNSTLAPESLTIAAKSAGVEDGAIGATATPARSAPRNVAAYSIEL